MTERNRVDGDPRTRIDAFAFQPGRGRRAIWALGAMGLFAIVAPVIDREVAPLWMIPAGLFLVAIAVWLLRMASKATLLIEVGPEGLLLPLSLASPLPWSSIKRIQRTRRRLNFLQELIHLKVELTTGARPDYRRAPMVWPLVDAWIARKWGLTIPLHNLDAPEDEVIVSIERFKPVQRVEE